LAAKEVTKDHYLDMLEVLPPADMAENGFLLGEPQTHNAQGQPVYDFYWTDGQGYYWGGYSTERQFESVCEEEQSLSDMVEKNDTAAADQWVKDAEAGEVKRII